MHIVDVKKGMLGATGIVGAGMPIAAGVGLAIKMKKTGQVGVCFFGDNASNGGTFHEALNVSALWKLPLVFVCENNLYGISVSVGKSSAVKDIALRAQGYGIPGVVVVRVLLSSTGEVRDARVHRSVGFGLDEEALTAVRRSTFRAARLRGRPVPCVFDVPFRFRLEG